MATNTDTGYLGYGAYSTSLAVVEQITSVTATAGERTKPFPFPSLGRIKRRGEQRENWCIHDSTPSSKAKGNASELLQVQEVLENQSSLPDG